MDQLTMAEALLSLARTIKHPLGTLIIPCECCSGSIDGKRLARVKLALDFDRLPAGIKFHAIMECWDYQRIMREVY